MEKTFNECHNVNSVHTKSNVISGSCKQPLNTKQAIRSGPQDITDIWIDLCVGEGYIKCLKKVSVHLRSSIDSIE